MSQHDDERGQDLRDRKKVFDLRAVDSLVAKILGSILLALFVAGLSVGGWVIVNQYDLNATVAVQNTKTNYLYDDVEGTPGNLGMKDEVSQMYEHFKANWKSQSTSNLNINPGSDITIGTTTPDSQLPARVPLTVN